MNDSPAPSDSNQQHQSHLGLALAVICVAQLMIVLDATIVNVALPSISRDLEFSETGLEWVITAYSLTFGGLLLLGGRTGDLWGRRRMFMTGIGLFGFASLLGGLAPNKELLIAARALQGAGGAIAAPTALALIATTFPEGQARNRAFGLYAAMAASGAAIGLLLGGILTDYASWRWTLAINVPIGLAIVLAAPRVLGESQGAKTGLDIPGAILGTAGMSSLVYGVSYAAGHEWTSDRTLIFLGAALALLVTFVVVELRVKAPMLPLRLLRNRNRVAAYLIMLCLASAMFGTFFFVSLYLQDIKGWGPMKSGLGFLPMALLIMATSITMARVVVQKIGVRIPLLVGPFLTMCAMLWLTQLEPDSSYLFLLGALCTMAVGMGCNFMPLTVTAVAGVDHHETGIASALLNTGQQLGGALGLATLGTIAAHAARDEAEGLARAGRLDEQAANLAAVEGFTHGFIAAAVVVGISLLLSLLLIRVPKQASGALGHASAEV